MAGRKCILHLCDLVEGKRFIHLVIKRTVTYFPQPNEVDSSHGTAKAASFLHEDGVLGTLNIVGSFKAYVIYDIEDGLGARKCMRNCDLFKQRKHISAHKTVAPLSTRPSHYFSPKNLLGLSRLVTAVILTIPIPKSNYIRQKYRD